METFEQFALDKDFALPYIVGTFAVRALHVLLEPTHHMYPKVNRYLMKSPQWRVSRLPSYWLEATILEQPEEDDGYWKEVQWVLDWLVDGLRTRSDMDLLRRAGVFERVTGVCSSPGASEKLVKEKVLELVYRAAIVDANTLVSRTGCLAWLDMQSRGQGPEASVKEFVLGKADKRRLTEWAGVEV